MGLFDVPVITFSYKISPQNAPRRDLNIVLILLDFKTPSGDRVLDPGKTLIFFSPTNPSRLTMKSLCCAF